MGAVSLGRIFIYSLDNQSRLPINGSTIVKLSRKCASNFLFVTLILSLIRVRAIDVDPIRRTRCRNFWSAEYLLSIYHISIAIVIKSRLLIRRDKITRINASDLNYTVYTSQKYAILMSLEITIKFFKWMNVYSYQRSWHYFPHTALIDVLRKYTLANNTHRQLDQIISNLLQVYVRLQIFASFRFRSVSCRTLW